MTNENDDIVVNLLDERYGKKTVKVDVHYSQQMDIKPAIFKTHSLRTLYDNMEKHLISLESLEEDMRTISSR